MGFKTGRIGWWAILILLLVPVLLVGCNRSATAPEPTVESGEGEVAGQTPEQEMPTVPAPTAELAQPDLEATAAAAQATAQAEQPVEPPPEATAVPVELQPTAAPPPPPTAEQTYIVVAGDTLYSIAQKYGVTVEELAARNSVINVHQIEVGQQVVIPVPGAPPPEPAPAAGEQVHVVLPGENLFRVALAYDLSFETVAAYNDIPWPYYIYPGQEIKIPPAP